MNLYQPVTTPQGEELKPCPFCGKSLQEKDYRDNDYMIWCANCGCIGPNDVTPYLAIESWNRRRIEEQYQLAMKQDLYDHRKEVARLTAELDAARARIAELENTQTVILGMENPEIDLFLGDDQ